MARYGQLNRIYVFYKIEHGQAFQKVIPEWRLRDWSTGNPDYGGYRRIAAALLDRYQLLPPIRVRFSGPAAEVRLGYLLPPAEENFFKLYSWPVVQRDNSKAFSRIMMEPIYNVFKEHLEKVGYRFEEG